MQLKSSKKKGARTIEQLSNHYEVEKAIATKLKQASREERKLIYQTMYDELFRQVPDHPRLQRRSNQQLTEIANQGKLKLIESFVDSNTTFLEFAPGDCQFATAICDRVKSVYGVDISDQREQKQARQTNFHLIVYDGYNLQLPENSIDVIFSDQLIEHFHPEDTQLHFQLVEKILKPQGLYIFRTPHKFTGPHDISGYFAEEAEGFHLKEWTYSELAKLLKQLNYSGWRGYWYAESKGLLIRLPFIYFILMEKLLEFFPPKYRKTLTKYLFTSSGITMIAVK
jgi:SAM-dependent methyltransferase